MFIYPNTKGKSSAPVACVERCPTCQSSLVVSEKGPEMLEDGSEQEYVTVCCETCKRRVTMGEYSERGGPRRAPSEMACRFLARIALANAVGVRSANSALIAPE